MIRFIPGRRVIWMFVPSVLAFVLIAGCGSSDEPAIASPSISPDAVQTEVAAALATQASLQKQVDDSVAATVDARSQSSIPVSETDNVDNASSPTATSSVEPTATPSPPATLQPDPTATAVPPTATLAPPAPTEPPQPTEVPPTPTQAAPAELTFIRPDDGRGTASGEYLSFAQASSSFDIAQFPARAYIRSGVYFGLSEDVSSVGTIENSFEAEVTGKIRVVADAGWNGSLSTKGWGSMNSEFEIRLAILGPDGQAIKAPVVGGKESIDSSVASKSVSGNQSLVIEGLVEEGGTYTIQLIAVCNSSGSSNIWASDTECAFDSGVNGFVEWRSLTVEYLP